MVMMEGVERENVPRPMVGRGMGVGRENEVGREDEGETGRDILGRGGRGMVCNADLGVY